MAGSRFLRRAGRRLSVVIARRVQTNELFERPSERLRQPPVFDKDAKAANGDAASAPTDPDPQSEEPPPKNSEQCTIASLADIKQVLRGDGTHKIINHWATWCAPCKEEMPSLNEIKNIIEFKDINIIPINIGEEEIEKSKKFFEELKINNLEIFSGPSGDLAKKFKLRGVPTTVILDKQGYEVSRIIGSIDFKDEKFLNWLRNIINS